MHPQFQAVVLKLRCIGVFIKAISKTLELGGHQIQLGNFLSNVPKLTYTLKAAAYIVKHTPLWSCMCQIALLALFSVRL